MNMQIQNNPDPNKFVKTTEGYALRPKQCPTCKGLFTPLTELAIECSECMKSVDYLKKQALKIRHKINWCRKNGNALKLQELMNEYTVLTGKTIRFYK